MPWLQPYVLRERLTLRSILVGLLFAHAVSWLIMVSVYNVRSSWLVFGHMPVAVMLPFVVLALGVNVALRRFLPRLALSRTELLVVFAMGLIASVIPEFRLTGYFLSVITAPVYFASPENRWDEVLLPILPKWLIVSDETHAVTWFYNGLPAGASIPWGEWVGPVFWWTTFFAALFAVTGALVVIFRRPWEEHERLVFPLAQVPLAMVEESRPSETAPAPLTPFPSPIGRGEGEGPRPWLPDLFRRRAFWWGAAIPVAIVLWNLPSWWRPDWPRLPLMNDEYQQIYFGPDFPPLRIRLNPWVMAFAFFAHLDILFSIWFFVLVATVQLGLYQRIGFLAGEVHPFVRESSIGWQAFGALVVLVAAGVWTARVHLRRAAARAVLGRSGLDDSAEFMSYRAAFVTLAVGLVYAVVWLVRAGLTPGTALLYTAAYLVLVVGVSKIIAQCGLVLARAPMTAQNFTMFTLGTRGLPDATMGAFALCFAFICDGNPFLMPQVSHAGKLGAGLGRQKRLLFGALAATALTVFLVSVVLSLRIGYARGVQNCSPSGLSDSAWVFQTYARLVPASARVESDPRRLGCFAGGAAVGLALLLLRARFAWWPLHPAGLALCMSTAIKFSFFPVFMAWFVKLIVLKVGGYRLYRRTAPLMVGVVAGYVLAVGVGLAVDALFFPGRGHSIHGW